MPPPPTKRASTRIACATHSAPVLRTELEGLGWGQPGQEFQEEHATYLQVGATLEQAMELALRLRTATQVMWQLARFRCPSPKALYKEVAAYPWEDLFHPPPHPDAYLTIRASTDTPTIDNQMYPALVVKDAICDRMVKKTGARPDAGPERRGIVLSLYWKDDRAALFLNINAQSLSNRGYRHLPHTAPMRETLAAATLLAAGYDGSTPLVNPMCGSGTIAIEAALIATNRAPGLLRPDYAITRTNWDINDLWQSTRARIKREGAVPAPSPSGTGFQPVSSPSSPPPIIATDHDPLALHAARKNAQAAGVDHLIKFIECDFRQTPIPQTPGHIILNPEYGERMGDATELEDTYAAIGDFFKQSCPGWTGHVFTGSPQLAKRIGLKPARKRPFMNGPIECRLLTFQLYTGSNREAAPQIAPKSLPPPPPIP